MGQFSDQPFVDILTLSDIWNEMYDDDTQTIELIGIFGGLSIVISVLGLAGLAAYSTQQRSKEVAIRKVFGASITNILTFLSMSMVKVVAIAAIPGLIGAYYFSNIWLERFAYRAEFSSAPYLLAIGVVGLLSIVVLIMQTYQAAQANPVIKLKYE